MNNEQFNDRIEHLLNENKIKKNNTVNKTSTITIPYNKKIIGNLKKTLKSHQLNDKDNFYIKKYCFSDNLSTELINKNNNFSKNNNYDNKIDNKVINININYNDKYNYFGKNPDMKDIKNNLEFNFLNNQLKENNSNNYLSPVKNNILEIDLKNIKTEKKRIKHSITCKNSFFPLQTNSYDNTINKNTNVNQNINITESNNQKNSKICAKALIIKNINNKTKINKPKITPRKRIIDEKKFNNNISNLIKDVNIISLLNNNNNLEDRKKGFLKLEEFIMNEQNKNIIKNNLNDFFMLIYYNLNNFKENNIILLTEGLYCILNLFECIIKNNVTNQKKDINKIYMELIINNFKYKIIDIRIKNIFFKLLYLFNNIYSTKDIFDILLNNISINENDNNIDIIQDYLIFIKNIIERNKVKNKDNLKGINIINLINFIDKISNIENNEELKPSYITILCMLYRIYGKKFKEILKEINESLLKLVEKELKLMAENEKNNNQKNNQSKIGQSKSFKMKKHKSIFNKKKNYNNIRKNISKEIDQKIIIQISSDDFEIKKKAVDYINNLIKKYNNISINGLKELIFAIKDLINDVEPKKVYIILQLLSNLIIALGSQIKIYSNNLIYPLILNLSNKSQQIREISSNCIENLIKILGFNIFSRYAPKLLNNKNINMKLETLKLLLNNYNLIEVNNNENFILNLCKSLINCLISNSILIRNSTEKLIKKLFNIIKKDVYLEEIKTRNINIKKKEYLFQKINFLFSNYESRNKNINKIIINNNRSMKQNSFKINRANLLSEISSDNDINNTNTNINTNTNSNYNTDQSKIHYKQKIFERRNISDFSNLSTNAFNLKTYTLSLNRSIEQSNKNRKQKSLLNSDKTLNSILNNIYINKSPNLIKYSNDNINYNKIKVNNSLTIRRKKTELDKYNKLISSSILLTSKIQNRLTFDDDSKALPNDIKKEIKKLKMKLNLNNKNNKKLNYSERKKKLSNILLNTNLKQNISKSKKYYTSHMTENKNIFNETNHHNIFLYSNLENINDIQKNDKQMRYEQDKNLNFDIHEILDIKNLFILKKTFQNVLTDDFILRLFSEEINSIIFCLSQLNNLINNCILNKNKNIYDKIFNNLDILLKILSIQLCKYKDDFLTKSFFIFVYSLIELSKLTNYFFNDTEIAILLNILCNKLKNNKEILSETAYNLIFYLNDQCDNKLFMVTLSKLLKYQNYKVLQETIKIIQKLYEKSKYNNESISEIIENIVKIYFFNFYKNTNLKHNSILPLLKNIYESIGNKFWDYCEFLSKEKKEILSKNLCEFKQNNTFENFDNLYTINENINISSKKKNSCIYKNIFYYKNIDKKTNIKIKDENVKFNFKKYRKNNYIRLNQINDNNNSKVIKRNKTSENIKVYQNPDLSNNTSNNISFDKKNQNNFEKEEEIYDKNNENLIENKLLKALSVLNFEYSNEEIIIDSILTIYNLVYINYSKYKDIVLKNIDNIIDIFIKKIKKLLENIKSGIKIIKYLFNILYKLCFLQNLNTKMSFKIHQKLFQSLIYISINKEINMINEKTDNNEEKEIFKNIQIILKTVNSIIGHIVNYFDITNNILILINNIKNYRKKNVEIVECSIRCLFLVIQNIKKNNKNLKVYIIFNEIQNLFNKMGKTDDNLKIKNDNIDQSIIAIIKNLILEIVRYRKEVILEIEKNLENKYIKKIIYDILKNINNENNNDDFKKGYLFNGDTFYPRISNNIKLDTNEIGIYYSPDEQLEKSFKDIRRKWTKIHKNK